MRIEVIDPHGFCGGVKRAVGIAEKAVRNACGGRVYGLHEIVHNESVIRSLEAGHGLYRGEYSGDENTSRKQAYHNGTVWTWQFPMFAEAMAELGLCTKETALDVLASSVENLNSGCLCHVSEIADGDAPHAQKGCCAQAWGDSELLRVWLKLKTV